MFFLFLLGENNTPPFCVTKPTSWIIHQYLCAKESCTTLTSSEIISKIPSWEFAAVSVAWHRSHSWAVSCQVFVWNIYVTLVLKVLIIGYFQHNICSPRQASCGWQVMAAKSDGQLTLAGTAGSTCSSHPATCGILPLKVQLWAFLYLHCVQFELGHA